ncbi:hypothetical protein TNCV_433451 [Trichonephila clavipes]|nr:hypothetical protein TNCV_433451 [Trichonephila clavipes]
MALTSNTRKSFQSGRISQLKYILLMKAALKRAGGTDADTAIGNARAQMLVKLLELERLLELDHVSALVSLFSRFQSLFLR